METTKALKEAVAISNLDSERESQEAHSKLEEVSETKPEIIPLHVSCSQRPDWSCGPCKAYGAKRPWELV